MKQQENSEPVNHTTELQFTPKPKKNPKKPKSNRSKQNKQKVEEEKIKNFVDSENKYLSYFLRRIKTLGRKIASSEKIKEKLENGDEVQKEEKANFLNKDKMEFCVSELEKMLIQIKKYAIEDKAERLQKKRQQEKEDREVERSFQMRTENLEKELKQRAEKDKEEALQKKEQETDKFFEHAKSAAKQETTHFVLELHFASKFIELLHEKELQYLLLEMNAFLQSKAEKEKEPFLIPTEQDLACFRSFMMQVFPLPRQIQVVNSVKDEFANSTKLVHLLSLRSEDPIDGVFASFSFRRMADIAEAITKSSLFYNRYPHSLMQFPDGAVLEQIGTIGSIKTNSDEKIVPKKNEKELVNQKETALKENKAELPEASTTKTKEEKKANYVIPHKVPVSTDKNTDKNKSEMSIEKPTQPDDSKYRGRGRARGSAAGRRRGRGRGRGRGRRGTLRNGTENGIGKTNKPVERTAKKAPASKSSPTEKEAVPIETKRKAKMEKSTFSQTKDGQIKAKL